MSILRSAVFAMKISLVLLSSMIINAPIVYADCNSSVRLNNGYYEDGIDGPYTNNGNGTISDRGAVAMGGLEFNYGVCNHTHASPLMRHVTAEASGGQYSHGIRNFNAGSPTLINVTAKASGGLVTNMGMSNQGDEGTITAKNCSFEGATYSLQNDPQFSLHIASSELDGPVNTDGAWNCVNCYNGNFSALNSSCR